MNTAIWVAVICTILSISAIFLWVQYKHLGKHHMNYDFHWTSTPSPHIPTIDWDEAAEIEVFIPTPAVHKSVVQPKPLEECPQCGKAYKRVSQHIRMSHKVIADDTSS